MTVFDEMAGLVYLKQRQAAALDVDDCPECKVVEIDKSYELKVCAYHTDKVCACGCGCIGWCGVDERAEWHNDDKAVGI